ncbi:MULTISPECIES: hypothetical protein [unclassified Alteromonas]|uniref:hypothetical protein n=1 Tax=unclassified Alteromonas TaxID=2614992 RepID=UPI001EF304BC|nr:MULTISPECIES: hypothetical protein [unclassified Alteromonas]MCG7638522.1 hypothetical protein [Alteromonas sp. CNT1-28]MCG7813247.1 hypothetical protein [Alteromonas sp. MCA-1]
MHVGIVIPLKSKKISRDWQVTCQSLHATLSSIENQTNRSFTAIVIGHEKPDFLEYEFPDIIFETIDFPPPDRASSDFTHQKLVEDKNLKIVSGIKALRARKRVDYWYQIDADDLIHCDFINTITELKVSAAIIENGYILFKKSGKIIPTNEMSQYCGSTSILADHLIELPNHIDLQSIKCIPWASVAHKNMKDFLQERHPEDYEMLSPYLLCYVLASGDNISDSWRKSLYQRISHYFKPYVKGKKIPKDLALQFPLNQDVSNKRNQLN